jgi:hypothetical protein
MYQLLHNPADFYNHIRRYSTAVILASVYGQRGAEFNSPKVQALYHAQDQFTSILAPGATPPVDAFPILRYVPKSLAKWKNWAETIRKEQRSLYFDLMQETKDKLNKGAGTGCFMERLLHEQSRTGLSDDQIAYLGGILVCIECSKPPVDIWLTANRWKRDLTQHHLHCFPAYWGCSVTQKRLRQPNAK